MTVKLDQEPQQLADTLLPWPFLEASCTELISPKRKLYWILHRHKVPFRDKCQEEDMGLPTPRGGVHSLRCIFPVVCCIIQLGGRIAVGW